MEAPMRGLDAILHDPSFAPYIALEKTLPAAEGSFAPLPAGLDPRLREALRRRGLERLYSHQAETFDALADARNVVVVTPTASGKTLCYNLPVLHALLADPDARALYLFPTKALSQDQQSELNELVGSREWGVGSGGSDVKASVAAGNTSDDHTTPLLPTPYSPLPIKIATYDGDTPDPIRVSARDTGRVIITNPDMLHQGILPNHPRWIKFFSRLAFVVIDEMHIYSGVFGSHVADLIRRLRRVAAFYGSRPRFILCSATIANPRELAEALVGEEVTLVDKNGAPRGEKKIILYNPPLVDAVQGIRRSSVDESRRWALAFLRAGIKTILFAHSRVKTEVAASYLTQDLANLYTGSGGIRVVPYRGGLLPNERRGIERGLREGSIQGVVSTNALELGIDIGGLDASVVAGFPGSFNSFWQQSGRAGRRGGLSVSVFVASAAPIDQFIMENPDWFFRKAAEEARIDPDNAYILSDHVKCACFELPFRDEELTAPPLPPPSPSPPFGTAAADVLAFLEEDGIVRHTAGRWHWSDRSFPAERISLRSATADNVVIIDATDGRNRTIGEMDRPSAKELIFENAVYIHLGRQYLVEKLDIANRACYVREASVNYFTDGLVKTDIKVLSEDEAFSYPADGGRVGARGALCDLLVRSQVTKFKKIRFRTNENLGYGDINLPEEEMQTRGLVLLFGPDTHAGQALAAWDEAGVGAILSGAGTLVKQIAPIYLLCAPRDLGAAERTRDPHFGVPALCIYDKYPGGTGLSEALAAKTAPLFAAIRERVERCPCEKGCPSCVGAGGFKAGTRQFLAAL
ncbi:MAG: DEAD/DEAH box helicase [Treponema sp.]|jgi:DEAD/DEAH box helicase domain-containing protein|nr:DEAD/DEAH box helicase [Treponema sp.]